MRPLTCDEGFADILEAAGFAPEDVLPEAGIRLMLGFYHDERVEGCRIDEDGDALLYQWGTYDWGEGEAFDLNITRQLIDGDGEDEDILQLGLTFSFEPSAELRRVGAGNRWCFSPVELDELRSFIKASPAFAAIATLRPIQVVLRLEVAG